MAEVFASVPRKDQRAKSDCHLQGLMVAGPRSSIQPSQGTGRSGRGRLRHG